MLFAKLLLQLREQPIVNKKKVRQGDQVSHPVISMGRK